MPQKKKVLVIDNGALEVAKMGTMVDLLWFGWYTLNDNLEEPQKSVNKAVATDIIDYLKDFRGLCDKPIDNWSQSNCVLLLSFLKTERKMDWETYDSYQKTFWALLEAMVLCEVIWDNPLNPWLLHDVSWNIYNWNDVGNNE